MLARADYHTVTGTHIDHIKVDGSIIPRRSTPTHAVRGEDIVYWIERINACRSLEELELNTTKFKRHVLSVGSTELQSLQTSREQWNKIASGFFDHIVNGLVIYSHVPSSSHWYYDKDFILFWEIPDIAWRLVKNSVSNAELWRPKVLTGPQSTLVWAYREMRDKMYMLARDGCCSHVISRANADVLTDYSPKLSQWTVYKSQGWEDPIPLPGPDKKMTYGYTIDGWNEDSQHYYIRTYKWKHPAKVTLTIPSNLVPLIGGAQVVCKGYCQWEFLGMCDNQRGKSFKTVVQDVEFDADGIARFDPPMLLAQPPSDIGILPPAPALDADGNYFAYSGWIDCYTYIEALIFRISQKFDYRFA